ncbi:MAG TPA: hypothetical protein VH187_23275 [Scandinavium sp.]|jgi:hypothetical protein|uniref:hypothetical protein n=1 Tax=Scandinavium sp. TaxID=2830653 RepID=UPI002E320152|nr:hypothetical protein [Scandinavium sp.]HEX4504051.1 hypothetical protein [Scandinavium sp.]
METTKRHRVELDPYRYEVLRYFGLLQGRPIGHVMRRALSSFADAVQEENPPIRAHLLAMQAAAAAAGDVDREMDMIPF